MTHYAQTVLQQQSSVPKAKRHFLLCLC